MDWKWSENGEYGPKVTGTGENGQKVTGSGENGSKANNAIKFSIFPHFLRWMFFFCCGPWLQMHIEVWYTSAIKSYLIQI